MVQIAAEPTAIAALDNILTTKGADTTILGIARTLTEQGVPAPPDKGWTLAAVKRLLMAAGGREVGGTHKSRIGAIQG